MASIYGSVFLMKENNTINYVKEKSKRINYSRVTKYIGGRQDDSEGKSLCCAILVTQVQFLETTKSQE